jgi:Flp pilus assembly protein TadG
MNRAHVHEPRADRGATVVEFALVISVFLMLMLGAIEFGRVLFYWNTTAEATRLGARVAVVCDLDDSQVKTRMAALFPRLQATDISVSYLPAGCNVDSCQSVTVSVNPGKVIDTFIPFAEISLTMPPFTTTLSRESLQSTFDGVANPVCG